MNFKARFQQALAKAGKTARAILDAVTGKAPVQGAVEEIQTNVTASLVDAVNQILIPAMQEKLTDNDNIFRSDLHDSFVVRATGPESVQVTSNVDYAHLVEEGSAPRPISNEELDNLVEWAEFKFPTSPDPENIALVVAERIEEVGNNSHPFAAPALMESEDAMHAMVARQFATDIRLN